MEIYSAWIKNIVSTYSIDGLRIDTVKNVQPGFWNASGFPTAAGVYIVGEVDDGDPNFVCPYQYDISGTLNYPLYYPLTAAFESTSGSISGLVNMVNQIKSTCKDSTLLAPFLENQDNPRCKCGSCLTRIHAKKRLLPTLTRSLLSFSSLSYRRHHPGTKRNSLHPAIRRHPDHLRRPRTAPERYGHAIQPRGHLADGVQYRRAALRLHQRGQRAAQQGHVRRPQFCDVQGLPHL